MKITKPENLTPEACLQTMEAFWREQIEVAPTRDGLALTLPLMYPDGWQVTVFLSALTPGWMRLSDRGKTLGPFVEAGMNIDPKQSNTGKLLVERATAFEVQNDGAILSKDVRLPLQGLDVQVFAEALVSIAHLIYRHEPSTAHENPAENAVRRVFSARNVTPRRNAELEGILEHRIRVDYRVEARRPLAVHVVSRRDNLLGYMEQWAFRWSDLRKRNNQLLAAMVYDPENQVWDDTALRIGGEVCDCFCRYDDAEPLNQALTLAGA